jgi:hypothetical protein
MEGSCMTHFPGSMMAGQNRLNVLIVVGDQLELQKLHDAFGDLFMVKPTYAVIGEPLMGHRYDRVIVSVDTTNMASFQLHAAKQYIELCKLKLPPGKELNII